MPLATTGTTRGAKKKGDVLQMGQWRLYIRPEKLVKGPNTGEFMYYYAEIEGAPPKYVLTDDRGPYYSVGSNDCLQGSILNFGDFEICNFQGYLESADREIGLYRSRTGISEARVAFTQRYNKQPSVPWVEISTTDPYDAVQLLHEIREGTAYLAASYAEPQVDSRPLSLWCRLVLALVPVRPARFRRMKHSGLRWSKKSKRAKRLNPKFDHNFQCVACHKVSHGSKLGRNCGIPWLLACPEPGCGANVKPLPDEESPPN